MEERTMETRSMKKIRLAKKTKELTDEVDEDNISNSTNWYYEKEAKMWEIAMGAIEEMFR